MRPTPSASARAACTSTCPSPGSWASTDSARSREAPQCTATRSPAAAKACAMERPMPREPPVTRTARESLTPGSQPGARSPPPAVDDLVDAAPAAPQGRRPAVLRARVADRHHADRPVGARDAERRPQCVHALGRDAEEARAQPLVDGGQQHQQRGHAGVDVPVGDRPPGLVPVGPALVRLGVPLEVGGLRRQRHHQQRRAPHPGEPGIRGALGRRHRPEQLAVGGVLQHQERPALGEPGRRRAQRVLQQPLAHAGRYRPVGVVVAPHAPPADEFSELHRATLSPRRDPGAAAAGRRRRPAGDAGHRDRVPTLSGVPKLQLLPAVDVADGQAVRLVQGEAGSETSYGDPLDAAMQWQRDGAEWVHLVDLDAAFGRGSNRELLARVVGELDVDVELSGGIRDDDSLAAALATGCRRVNLGTAALESPEWCARAIAEHGERIAVGLDVRGTRLAARGWTQEGGELYETLARLDAEGCARYVLTDITKDGTLRGPNLDLLREVCAATPRPVVASGGISSLDDIRALAGLTTVGVEGAIVGKALYAGAFTLPEALKVTGESA